MTPRTLQRILTISLRFSAVILCMTAFESLHAGEISVGVVGNFSFERVGDQVGAGQNYPNSVSVPVNVASLGIHVGGITDEKFGFLYDLNLFWPLSAGFRGSQQDGDGTQEYGLDVTIYDRTVGVEAFLGAGGTLLEANIDLQLGFGIAWLLERLYYQGAESIFGTVILWGANVVGPSVNAALSYSLSELIFLQFRVIATYYLVELGPGGGGWGITLFAFGANGFSLSPSISIGFKL